MPLPVTALGPLVDLNRPPSARASLDSLEATDKQAVPIAELDHREPRPLPW